MESLGLDPTYDSSTQEIRVELLGGYPSLGAEEIASVYENSCAGYRDLSYLHELLARVMPGRWIFEPHLVPIDNIGPAVVYQFTDQASSAAFFSALLSFRMLDNLELLPTYNSNENKVMLTLVDFSKLSNQRKLPDLERKLLELLSREPETSVDTCRLSLRSYGMGTFLHNGST